MYIALTDCIWNLCWMLFVVLLYMCVTSLLELCCWNYVDYVVVYLVTLAPVYCLQ